MGGTAFGLGETRAAVLPEAQDGLKRTMAIITENFRRYRAGEDMLNPLTPEDIYTAG